MNEDKFTGKAAVYARYRFDYPAAFLEYLYTEVGFGASAAIADIGAGTGILSKQLLQRGGEVTCVEPNGDMLAAARKALAGFSKVRFVQASAENTGLENHCVHFVTAAQAFHWFDRALFKRECQRILQGNGMAVLVWNDWDTDSPITRDIAEVRAQYRENAEGSLRTREIDPAAYADFFREGRCEYRIFRNDRTEGEEALIGGCLSVSDAPKEGSQQYDAFVQALRGIFKTYSTNGVLTLPQVTRSYVSGV
ncbi:MAG: class I SAM-dependent methyltransferase [Oscillospiraceae bacterium]|nr:class I SAM-dependent methyltransferase [Oscillospiraceae bacterium]